MHIKLLASFAGNASHFATQTFGQIRAIRIDQRETLLYTVLQNSSVIVVLTWSIIGVHLVSRLPVDEQSPDAMYTNF